MEQFLVFKNGKYFAKSNTRKALTDEDAVQTILALDENTTVKQAKIDLEMLKRQAKSAAESKDESGDTEILEIIKEIDPLKNFFIVSVERSNTLVYYKSPYKIDVVSTLAAFNATHIISKLSEYEPDTLSNVYNRLSEHTGKKRLSFVSLDDVVAMVVNVLHPTLSLNRINLQEEPHPVGVESLCDFALSLVPFNRCDVTFQEMSKSMQSFLNRVEHHEYLCAIIWSFFSGNTLPYVIYLRGFGGDGKTGFINYIGRLAGSFASFDAKSGFSYYNMYGKAIISLEENESTHLMQNRVLKSITGGNLVQIEGKNKDAFTSQIKGLIFVDSNHDLECADTKDERRRLRFFRVKPLSEDANIITLSAYEKDLRSKNNEFLNYCRQCFERLEVKGSGGLVQKTPNHEVIFDSMKDLVLDAAFRDFFGRFIEPLYTVMEDATCDMTEILLLLDKAFKGDKFAKNNLKRWLYSNYGILADGKFLIGLKKKEEVSVKDLMPVE